MGDSTASGSLHESVQRAAAAVNAAIAPRAPKIGLVLGSGLGSFADTLDDAVAIPYGDIPGFARSKVVGHKGRLVAGTTDGGTQVLVMQGRVHRYEGHPLTQVVLPVRAMIAAGCRALIITNAAGGIRDDLSPGDLMLISDHINLQGSNPLVGANDPELGDRFPDMSIAYDHQLRAIARDRAGALGLTLSEGVYAAVLGPSYETPAEIRMLRTIGADVVGMSTAPEVIAARHMGARVLGISCVTNKAAGLGGILSHSEVEEVAGRARESFIGLVKALVETFATLDLDA